MGMKRKTPLTRKTPLKRTGKLRPMSAKKKSMQTRYRLYKENAMQRQINEQGCTHCERCGNPGPVETHHTQGRIGENLLTFRLVCDACHRAIHANGKKAREEGWLAK